VCERGVCVVGGKQSVPVGTACTRLSANLDLKALIRFDIRQDVP
jgi:hypothetical protein